MKKSLGGRSRRAIVQVSKQINMEIPEQFLYYGTRMHFDSEEDFRVSPSKC